jgi:hypothetical protein
MSNLVPVRNKLGEIILFVDFCNSNRAYEKKNYLVPPMEQILQLVSGSPMFSLLDGFSGCNQVLVAEPNQLKTSLRTKWGTFAYCREPFVLINIGDIFQMEMDILFKGMIIHRMVIYLNDVTIYSKQRVDHLQHLKHIF